MEALKRYKKSYKLRGRFNKSELVTAASTHFAQVTVNEYDVINTFVNLLKQNANNSP